jgi:hypothetical protein
VAGAFVRLDIRIVKECFAILDSGESVADICLARSNRFNLAAFELNARFVTLENMIITKGFAIGNRLSSHIDRETGRFPQKRK